jgi:hypothetical protein
MTVGRRHTLIEPALLHPEMVTHLRNVTILRLENVPTLSAWGSLSRLPAHQSRRAPRLEMPLPRK